MKYHGFYVKLSRDENIQREDKDGNQVISKGYLIEIFADELENQHIDTFSGAVGFELRNNRLEDAIQFAKDVIDSEEKLYQKIMDE